MEAYLNELSLHTVNSQTDVISVFDLLADCYRHARICGIREIKIRNSFFLYEFYPHYSFYNWIEDNRVDGDLRTLFKSVFGTVPFVNQILESYQNQHEQLLEMTYQGQQCIGLGLSSNKLYNTVAFSFAGVDWDLSLYNISINFLKENDNGDLIETTEDSMAKNISTINHVLIHQKFINSQIALTVPDGAQLWTNKEELFPNLRFCHSVEVQIGGANVQNEEFRQIVRVLFDLQNTAAKFDGNPIKPEDFSTKASPESLGRINKYRKQLNILCPDGYTRLFSWHSRFTPGAGRIHFFPFENESIILIGYVGKKIL